MDTFTNHFTPCPLTQDVDGMLSQLSDHILDHLHWLDVVFGRTYRYVIQIGGKNYDLPAVCGKNGQYQLLSPDSNLGNFCYFELTDSRDFHLHSNRQLTPLMISCSLVCWYDLRTIFPDDFPVPELLKADMIQCLNETLRSGVRFRVESIREEICSVFPTHPLSGIDPRYLRYPYAGFRIRGLVSPGESFQ